MKEKKEKKEKKDTKDVYRKETYEGYPVLVNNEKNQYCRRSMLKVLKDTFDSVQTQPKTFFMRYDVRFPKESTDIPHSNQLISEFQSDYIKELSRKKWNPKYVLTREQSREKHQHYHGILFLDGQKVQDISQPIAMAERIWQRKLELPPPSNHLEENGEANPHNHLIDPCTRARSGETVKNGIMLRNDDPQCEEKRKECFKRASYLAKVNTKNGGKGIREIFSSRAVKPK